MIHWLEAMKGVEPLSFGLQDRRSVSQLSYIAANWWTGRDSNPHKKFARLLCYRYITSPKLFISHLSSPQATNLIQDIFLFISVQAHGLKAWWLWVDSNHQSFAYETKALPLELHSRN